MRELLSNVVKITALLISLTLASAFLYGSGRCGRNFRHWRLTPRLTLNLGARWVYFSKDAVIGSQ